MPPRLLRVSYVLRGGIWNSIDLSNNPALAPPKGRRSAKKQSNVDHCLHNGAYGRQEEAIGLNLLEMIVLQ